MSNDYQKKIRLQRDQARATIQSMKQDHVLTDQAYLGALLAIQELTGCSMKEATQIAKSSYKTMHSGGKIATVIQQTPTRLMRAESLLSDIGYLASEVSSNLDDTVPTNVREAIEDIADKATNGIDRPLPSVEDVSKRLYNLAMIGLGLPVSK